MGHFSVFSMPTVVLLEQNESHILGFKLLVADFKTSLWNQRRKAIYKQSIYDDMFLPHYLNTVSPCLLGSCRRCHHHFTKLVSHRFSLSTVNLLWHIKVLTLYLCVKIALYLTDVGGVVMLVIL